jgi:uncharacterized membrane protein YeaQ/YmgE (transglycosylase-associated protein family)
VNQAITITIVPAQVITWIFIGIIAGFLAGVIVRGRRFGLLTSVIIGLIGAVIGNILFTVLRIQLPDAINPEISIHLSDILISFIGAVIVLLIAGLLYRRRVA